MEGVPAYYRTFEAEMVHICAPTLAGLKPGSIFSIGAGVAEEIDRKIEFWNEKLHAFGLSLRLLNVSPESRVRIVYLYRHRKMEHLVQDEKVRTFLEEYGYDCSSFESCLQKLSERLSEGCGFPHEIGIFLGYPLEDVIGFIENKGKNCLCCGTWKVYSNPEQAQKCFDQYQKCIRVYGSLYHTGRKIEQLAVAC